MDEFGDTHPAYGQPEGMFGGLLMLLRRMDNIDLIVLAVGAEAAAVSAAYYVVTATVGQPGPIQDFARTLQWIALVPIAWCAASYLLFHLVGRFPSLLGAIDWMDFLEPRFTATDDESPRGCRPVIFPLRLNREPPPLERRERFFVPMMKTIYLRQSVRQFDGELRVLATCVAHNWMGLIFRRVTVHVDQSFQVQCFGNTGSCFPRMPDASTPVQVDGERGIAVSVTVKSDREEEYLFAVCCAKAEFSRGDVITFQGTYGVAGAGIRTGAPGPGEVWSREFAWICEKP